MTLEEIKNKVIAGGVIGRAEADFLATVPLDALCDAADEITRHFHGTAMDSCSIVNARSGRCGEDCKWCAQASRHHTGCATYNMLDPGEALAAARRNEEAGIRRFSLVTSGRAVSSSDIDKFCDIYRMLRKETGLFLCASMGLIGREEMHKLKEAGVSRYHCNMETSRVHFATLCTTHTPDDKIRTIRAAREEGMSVCSGGIIGMGETLAQRLDFAFELRDIDPDSVPINVLSPIPNTPLADQPLIGEEEIIRTAALFRFILPRKALRFAGGRLRISREAQKRMLRGGVNGVLMGDMLTTVSNQIDDDRIMFREAGLDF